MRAELFNLKQSLGKMKQRVLYNPKSKRHEIYKSRDIERRMAMANGESLAADSDDEDNEDEINEAISDTVSNQGGHTPLGALKDKL